MRFAVWSFILVALVAGPILAVAAQFADDASPVVVLVTLVILWVALYILAIRRYGRDMGGTRR